MAKRLETLNKLAQQLPKVESNTSLKTYFNSSQNLYNQAEIFQHDGDLEKAYIFYMRFAVFLTERIPKHKSYSNPEFEELRAEFRTKCITALDELTTIKGELIKMYTQIEEEETRKKRIEETKKREAEELKARLQREKEEEEIRAKNKKEHESSDDDLLDYLHEDNTAAYSPHSFDAPIIIDKEQDELLSKFKRLQPAGAQNSPAEKSAPSSGLSSLINSNNTSANNGFDVDALASATWSTNSLMEGIIYDNKNNVRRNSNSDLSLEDFTNSILFKREPEPLIIEEVRLPPQTEISHPVHETVEVANGHDAGTNVQLINEELMVQQLAMFDQKMNDTIFSGQVAPLAKTEPIDFLPQSFSHTVTDVFSHVNNEKRDKILPKTSTQSDGDAMVAVRPKKESVKEPTKPEKLGPPPSYDALMKIVEEKKHEQKTAVVAKPQVPVKNITPVAAVKSPAVNPISPQVNAQPNAVAAHNVTPQRPAPVVKDDKQELLAAAKAKVDQEQLALMLKAQPSAPPMEDTNKGGEVFSELKNFIEESKNAPTSIIPAALSDVKSDTKPGAGSTISNLVKNNNPSLYNFPRVEEAAAPMVPKVVENRDKDKKEKEKKSKPKEKSRVRSPKSSNDTSSVSVPKEIQMQLEQQKQQIEQLQQQVSEQQRLQQQYVQYYQLMQQVHGPSQAHSHDHGDSKHSHGHHGSNSTSGTASPVAVSSPAVPKQAPLPIPQPLPLPQSKSVSANPSASRMQALPPPAAKQATNPNQLMPLHAPLTMPPTSGTAQQLQQQLQQAASPFPVIYGVPVVFRPYNLNLPTATNVAKSLGLNKQQQIQFQEQQFQHIYQTNKTGGIIPNLQITPDVAVKEPAKPKQPEKAPEIVKKKPQKLIGGLRPMEVDGELFNAFMEHANNNTSRSIETCGILCGVFDELNEVFQVTCLMIPKQVGTSDTCATTDEEEIFDFQMKNDLLTLGWIHTHPTQSCFLSSVDLHTQCSYQSLFPEAIAVVIAPKFNPNFRIFNLTDRGLGIVQRCPRSGFHYHEEEDLYNTSDHVRIQWGKKKHRVVDMRKSSYGR